MHTLIDKDGNVYNIELKIKKNKLMAKWDGEETEINLAKCDIFIKDKE